MLAGAYANGRQTNSVELFRASPSVASRLLAKKAPNKDSYHTSTSELKSDVCQVWQRACLPLKPLAVPLVDVHADCRQHCLHYESLWAMLSDWLWSCCAVAAKHNPVLGPQRAHGCGIWSRRGYQGLARLLSTKKPVERVRA